MVKEEIWNTKVNKLEKPKFYLFEIPKFRCPNCNEGFLGIEKDKIIFETTEKSKKAYDITGESEFYNGQFAAIVRCNNPDCKEITTISGLTELKQDGWDDGIDPDTFEELYSPTPTYKDVYEIQYISPPIKLIDLPERIDDGIKETLNKSFSLFWIDENSCANKIRIALEQLLDTQGIVRSIINEKGKTIDLTLHRRIEKFEYNKPDLGKLLLAVKWIGNAGSHYQIDLERKDLMDAYKIIELCLKELFDNTTEEVYELAKIINDNKGVKK